MPRHILQLTYEEYCKCNKNLQNTILDHYIILEQIGSGNYSSVYRGVDDETKKQIGIKIIDLINVQENLPNHQMRNLMKQSIQEQLIVFTNCNSPYIMKCFDIYQNEQLKIVIIQYCNGGTLENYLKMNEQNLSQKEAVDLIKQLIIGLSEIHKLNIINIDISTHNLMIHNGILKIVDLKYSKILHKEQINHKIVPIQVLKRQVFGVKANVWSIGIILYQIIYGFPPYQYIHNQCLQQQILTKNIFPNNGKMKGIEPSNDLLDFMKDILAVHSHERMGWKQMLMSPILIQGQEEIPQKFRISPMLRSYFQKQNQNNKFQELQSTYLVLAQEKPQQVVKEVFVRWLSVKQAKLKNKQIKNKDIEMRRWVLDNHLQVLKANLIYRNVILPLQERKVLDISMRKNIQYLYLLTARCFFNLSAINNQIQFNSEELLVLFKHKTVSLFEEVKNKFIFYCDCLKNTQDRLINIVGDRFAKIFNNEDAKVKELYLLGVQGIDYTKQQQITFTSEFFIKKIQGNMDPKCIVLSQYIKKYDMINFIRLEQLVNKSFSERVKEIVKD